MTHIQLLLALCLGVANGLMPFNPRAVNLNAVSDDELIRQLNLLTQPTTTTRPSTSRVKTPYQPVTTPYTPPASQEGCGWRDLNGYGWRIGGGSDSNYEEFKWTIAIFNLNNNSYHCVGSLIHPRVVMSVGHRFDARGRWAARAGAYSLAGDNGFYEPQEREVAEVVLHPSYNKNFLRNDIALLFLTSAFDQTGHLGTLCLPPAQTFSPPGLRCIVTGWGYDKLEGGTIPDVMKVLDLPIVESTACARALRPTVGIAFDVHTSAICAGGERGKDACLRDGGAPLACPYAGQTNRYYQAGIVSWGSGCGREGLPGVYVNVAEMRTWIDQTMASRGYGTDTYTYKP